MKKILLLVFITLGILACDQKSTDGTKDRARAEEESGAEVQNETLAKKSKAMEDDLRKRYRFFAGVEGNYEGRFKIEKNNYKLKMTIVPTLRLVETNRVRSLEEIQDDINNLMLNAQTAVWAETDNIGIGGCVFDKVRPDINSGTIQLASSECPNRFSISLTTLNTSAKDRTEIASLLAKALFDGAESRIEYLYSDVTSKFNPQGYSALIKKLN